MRRHARRGLSLYQRLRSIARSRSSSWLASLRSRRTSAASDVVTSSIVRERMQANREPRESLGSQLCGCRLEDGEDDSCRVVGAPTEPGVSWPLLRRWWQRAVPLSLRGRLHVWRQDRRRRKRVDLGDLARTTPIELHWGRTRGGPVDRYYIERFLEQHAADIQGRVLEVGDAGYTGRFGARVASIDVLDIDPDNEQATIIADVTHLEGVPDDTFDCIVFTQVLQLVFDTRSAVSSLARVLSPGGVLLATLPGVLRSAPGKWDYWRFTAASARRLAEEWFPLAAVEVETYGNVLAATALLYGLGQNDIGAETLDVKDPAFEVTIAIRAVKAG